MFITTEEVYQEVKTVREIVTGNGHPETGMLVKQIRMEERQKAMAGDVSEIKGMLRDHIQKVENRKSGNGKVFNLVPIKVLETTWMWIVRSVIVYFLGEKALTLF